MSITKTEVVTKFKELHQKYYVSRGFLMYNIPDETSEKVFADAVWHEIYNQYASEHVLIRSLNVTVPLFGHDFIMQFDRPLVVDHHCEFEEYFGFGGHCKGFHTNRTIAHFPSNFDAKLNIDQLLLHDDNDAARPIDAEYAKRAITLLVLGGYVKYWKAVHEFEEWFVDVAGITECTKFVESNELLTRIFEVMQFEYIQIVI